MIKHVIVQAGGKGSRMGTLSENKPKCLISVNGTTVLQTISIAFPDATLHIIGDYKIEVLQNYLEVVNPDFEYDIIKANRHGTNAGIVEALNFIPNGEPFGISWSDLFYQSPILIPEEFGNYIGLTNSNNCRYAFEDGKFREIGTDINGVIGLFLFKDKSLLSALPNEGEFVRFLARSNIELIPLVVDSVQEIGTLDKYLAFKSKFPISRFFNNIEVENEGVTKRATDPKFQHLLEDEINWYRYMEQHKFTGIPKVLSYEPLKLERIRGLHPYQIKGLNYNDKSSLIEKIINRLDEVHSFASSPVDRRDLYNVYVTKTLERVKPVVRILKLKPNEGFIVNGKKVETLTPEEPDRIIDLFNKLSMITIFSTIHGDPTFSNTFITESNEIKFIDPRGYFGNSKIFGDPRYDFAKLYYSTNGNYDQFNNGNFKIRMNFPEVEVKMVSSQFEFKDEVFQEKFQKFHSDIKILHALIWLSLSGYVLNDYDSMVAAYFMGLYYLDSVQND